MMIKKNLEIENLSVEIAGKKILKNLSLVIPAGEFHALFGPNGAGKSILLMTIMGYPHCRITGGEIRLGGKNLSELEINERVNLGLGISEQRPPTLKGVRYRGLLHALGSIKGIPQDWITRETTTHNMELWLDRGVNDGLSGGESKAMELFLLYLQKPGILLLDEPDSGLDPVQLARMARLIELSLGRSQPKDPAGISEENSVRKDISGLLVTHSTAIMEHIHVDRAHLLMEGSIQCSGDPERMMKTIRRHGYEHCRDCHEAAYA